MKQSAPRRPSQSVKKGGIQKPRASGLSREKIVESVLHYLRANPDGLLSAAKAAATVGATPMALYRHFEDMADLTNALVSEVLGDIDKEIPSQGDWLIQVEAWLRAVHRRLEQTPQCVSMLSTPKEVTTGWIRAVAVLLKCLRRGGLEGHALSENVFWITMILIGFARQTLGTSVEGTINKNLAAIGKLPKDEADDLAAFAEDLPGIFRCGLDVLIGHIIASLRAQQNLA